MGSGKGKTRRTQTTARATDPNTVWCEFLEKNHLSSQTVEQYYVGCQFDHRSEHKAGQVTRVAREYFQDLLAIGALTPFAGQSSDDFSVISRTENDRAGIQREYLFLISKANGKETKVFPDPVANVLYPGASLKSHEMGRIAVALWQAMATITDNA